MLKVQEFILENGNDYNAVSQLGIKVVESEHHIILNYDQIDAPKTHPVVQECRGLVLDKHTLGIAAKPFSRFFNLGEMDEITKNFVWDKPFHCYEKMDGSLSIVWFDYYANEWKFNTRGSFGNSELAFEKSWSEYMKSCITEDQLNQMDTCHTYVFEFCSPYNKVVRDYSTPKMVLLGVFYGKTEFIPIAVDVYAEVIGFERPRKFTFNSLDEVKEFIAKQEETDPTFEGVVVQDCNGLRLKIKSSTYVSLHQLKGNGNLFLLKNLIPFILAGETDEVISYFPEAKESVEKCQKDIEKLFEELTVVWEKCKNIENQKDFALCITKDNYTPFASILFRMKVDKVINDFSELKKRFRDSKDLIIKVMKG